jgi:hypothetical protein
MNKLEMPSERKIGAKRVCVYLKLKASFHSVHTTGDLAAMAPRQSRWLCDHPSPSDGGTDGVAAVVADDATLAGQPPIQEARFIRLAFAGRTLKLLALRGPADVVRFPPSHGCREDGLGFARTARARGQQQGVGSAGR